MEYLEAPRECFGMVHTKSVFLAGGITNCPDWQAEIVEKLDHTDLFLLNPRRAQFPTDDPNAAEEQIKWEYKYLHKAHSILFWFPSETLCPIVLYELGYWNHSFKKCFIGIHPDYKRRRDVEIQTELVKSAYQSNCKPTFFYNLNDLANEVIEYYKNKPREYK